MKKIFALFLCVLISGLCIIPAFASASREEEIEYLDDGSYYISIVSDNKENEYESGIFARLLEFFRKLIDFFRGQKSVSKTKYLNYYSSDGRLLWTAALEADFIYSKNNATCTDADFYMNIYDSDWKLHSSESSFETDTAHAHFSVKQYKLLVPLKTIEKYMTLTCDNKGGVR